MIMRKYLFLLSLAAILCVSACDEVEIPATPETIASLEVLQESLGYFQSGISFSATAADGALTVKIGFTSSLDWSASIVDAGGSSVSWLTVSPTSGKAGQAELTVTARDNTLEQPRSATLTVTCGDISKSVKITQAGYVPPRVEVTEVILSSWELELDPGQSEQLEVIVHPDDATDKTVTWSSSDTSVATVAEGTVTAVAPGEAVITASAGNVKDECKVTVIDPAALRAVDLGVNVKWANMNLGAAAPEEYGDYYAWGEIEPYYSSQDPLTWKDGKAAGYAWESYRWCNDGDYKKLTKYCPAYKTDYWDGDGSPDDKTVLDPEDDAAHVQLGGKWRMPTDADWTKLRNNCTWKWTSDYNGTGVAGMVISSSSTGKSIFLPAAGYRWSTKEDVYKAGSQGLYWSTIDPDYPNSAYYRYFSSGTDYRRSEQRYEGLSVRPVLE